MGKFRKLWKGRRAGYKRPPITNFPPPLNLTEEQIRTPVHPPAPPWLTDWEYEKLKAEREQKQLSG